MSRRPSLRQLELGAPPGAWAAAGFAVEGTRCRIGDVELALHGGEGGIRGWTLGAAPDAPAGPEHPNGATHLDHVVLVTDALARSLPELEALGLSVRRVREAGDGRRQAFLWLGRRQLLLEVVEAPGAPPGEARLWGLTVVVADLDAAAAWLGEALSPPRAAVQPGRRIATVRREAGLGVPVALMTPHHRSAA